MNVAGDQRSLREGTEMWTVDFRRSIRPERRGPIRNRTGWQAKRGLSGNARKATRLNDARKGGVPPYLRNLWARKLDHLPRRCARLRGLGGPVRHAPRMVCDNQGNMPSARMPEQLAVRPRPGVISCRRLKRFTMSQAGGPGIQSQQIAGRGSESDHSRPQMPLPQHRPTIWRPGRLSPIATAFVQSASRTWRAGPVPGAARPRPPGRRHARCGTKPCSHCLMIGRRHSRTHARAQAPRPKRLADSQSLLPPNIGAEPVLESQRLVIPRSRRVAQEPPDRQWRYWSSPCCFPVLPGQTSAPAKPINCTGDPVVIPFASDRHAIASRSKRQPDELWARFDFGILVDGAVIVIEGTLLMLGQKRAELGPVIIRRRRPGRGRSRRRARGGGPLLFAEPSFLLVNRTDPHAEGVEGKTLFQPMARPSACLGGCIHLVRSPLPGDGGAVRARTQDQSSI